MVETRIWWVRHGPTHQKNFVGWRDVPADLSDLAAIGRLDRFLPSAALVVSSDLIRSSATADAIQATRERLPDLRDLREMNFGDWDGKHFSEVAQTHPEESRAFWETPGDIRPPNGESWNDTSTRVGSQVDKLCAKYAGRDIIAVAHIGVILTQVHRARNTSAYSVLAQKIDNLSVTCLKFSDQWSEGVVNYCP